MSDPNYKITNNILNSIIKFEVEKKGIESKNLEDSVVQQSRLSANTADIFHLANMLDLNITLKTAKKIASGKTLEIEDYKGQYLTNFRNAVEYILATQSSYRSVQSNILLHLNKILITGVAEEWDSKFRSGGEEIVKKDDNWIDFHDQNIPSVEVQARALKVMEWFTSNINRVHPMITIPIALLQLIRISPFVWGNKITILAICKYLFFKGDLYLNGMFSILKCFDNFEKEYFDSWKKVIESGNDFTPWIEFFTKTIANELKHTTEEVEKQILENKEKNKQPFLDLNKRQLKILRYLQNIPQVKREEYVEIMDVSTMTAYRDLTELVKKGLLKVEGQGRGTKYMLTTR